MSLFATLKRNAKRALAGQWGTAMGAGVFVAGVGLLMAGLEHLALRLFVVEPLLQSPTMDPREFDLAQFTRELLSYSWAELLISALFMLLSLLLLSPLSLGLTRWYYSLIQGGRPGFSEIFYFFETMSRYLRAVWYTVQLNLRCFFWGIAFFIVPGGVTGISVWFLRTEGISRETRSVASVGVVLGCALLFLASALLIIYLNKYALAAYLLCENDAMTVRGALRTSIRYTKTYRVVLLLFSLSFIGWYLLVPLTFFFILLFLSPYHSASQTLLARYLVEKNRLGEPESTREWHPVK